MKIDLAVWTAVNGYEWQEGHLYTQRDLATYKDAIGQLQPDKFPTSGLFLKDGKAVFWRAQIANRMDSWGRGAIYCVLGTVPEEKAAEIDFKTVFQSDEFARPQKPFPTTMECPSMRPEPKNPLGPQGFDERRFKGVETLCEIGGWCEEARGGSLKIRIDGPLDAPQDNPFITVWYQPAKQMELAKQVESEKPCAKTHSSGSPIDAHVHRPHEEIPEFKSETFFSDDQLKIGFLLGFVVGVASTAFLAWMIWPKQITFRELVTEQLAEVSENIPLPSPNISAHPPATPEKEETQPPSSASSVEMIHQYDR